MQKVNLACRIWTSFTTSQLSYYYCQQIQIHKKYHYSHGTVTFVYPINNRSRNRHRYLWDRLCVSSVWPPDWFVYLNELSIDIWFTSKSLIDRVCHLYSFVLADGKRGGLWCPALSEHWLSYAAACCQYLFDMKCLMYGLLFLQLSNFSPLGSRMLPPTNFRLENRIGLVTNHGSYLYNKFSIIRA